MALHLQRYGVFPRCRARQIDAKHHVAAHRLVPGRPDIAVRDVQRAGIVAALGRDPHPAAGHVRPAPCTVPARRARIRIVDRSYRHCRFGHDLLRRDGQHRHIVDRHRVARRAAEDQAQLHAGRVRGHRERTGLRRPAVLQQTFDVRRQPEILRRRAVVEEIVPGRDQHRLLSAALRVEGHAVGHAALHRQRGARQRNEAAVRHGGRALRHHQMLARFPGGHMQRIAGAVVAQLPSARARTGRDTLKGAVELVDRQIGVQNILEAAVFQQIDLDHGGRVPGGKAALAGKHVLTALLVRHPDIVDVDVAFIIILAEGKIKLVLPVGREVVRKQRPIVEADLVRRRHVDRTVVDHGQRTEAERRAAGSHVPLDPQRHGVFASGRHRARRDDAEPHIPGRRFVDDMQRPGGAGIALVHRFHIPRFVVAPRRARAEPCPGRKAAGCGVRIQRRPFAETVDVRVIHGINVACRAAVGRAELHRDTQEMRALRHVRRADDRRIALARCALGDPLALAHRSRAFLVGIVFGDQHRTRRGRRAAHICADLVRRAARYGDRVGKQLARAPSGQGHLRTVAADTVGQRKRAVFDRPGRKARKDTVVPFGRHQRDRHGTQQHQQAKQDDACPSAEVG